MENGAVLMEDGTWSGIIGMVARGEADMGLTYLAIMEDRSEVVDFSAPYYTIDRTFVTDKPGQLPKYAVFLYPFELKVWILFFIFLVIMPFLVRNLIFSRTYIISHLPDPLKQLFRFISREQSIESSILQTTWLIAFTFIIFIYSSVLLSFLLVPLQDPGIKDFHEMAYAVQKGNFKCLAPEGSVDVQLMLKSDSYHLKVLGNVIRQKNWFYQSRNVDTSKTIGKKLALLGPRLILQSRYGIPPFTNKFISDDSIVEMSTAIALKKGFCCKSRLDDVILRIVSGGLFQKLVDEKLFETRTLLSSVTSTKAATKSLTISDVYGIFLLLTLSYMASFLLLTAEILYKRYNIEKP
ncbi:Glutamate receptor ionotropic like protein [Argiope bruennichi]|uniref:Glutamate receptor ionotropic like protein n=1 Tax=Argiope bruennichi TaxID=94029 RepID=A0A8T0EMV5_ARGBR|nr:Glutamate receptor ionotropic like protein [Argiope bruennichi]